MDIDYAELGVVELIVYDCTTVLVVFFITQCYRNSTCQQRYTHYLKSLNFISIFTKTHIQSKDIRHSATVGRNKHQKTMVLTKLKDILSENTINRKNVMYFILIFILLFNKYGFIFSLKQLSCFYKSLIFPVIVFNTTVIIDLRETYSKQAVVSSSVVLLCRQACNFVMQKCRSK